MYRMYQCVEKKKKEKPTTTTAQNKMRRVEIRLIEVVRSAVQCSSVDREIDKEVDKRIPK